MAKRANVDVTIAARMELWEWGLSNGFENLHDHNCLYSKLKDGRRVRLNFRDADVLRRQVARQRNEAELKENPYRRGNVWEDVEVAPYVAVKIVDDGLIFKPKIETKKKKKEEPIGDK